MLGGTHAPGSGYCAAAVGGGGLSFCGICRATVICHWDDGLPIERWLGLAAGSLCMRIETVGSFAHFVCG